MIRKSILYISYDGMLEPLGQSQVLAYLIPLAHHNVIYLISYEKKEDWLNIKERENLKRKIKESGIVWHPLRYHKKPTALVTLFDIFIGMILSLWLVLRHKIGIIHARSYVPSLIAIFLKRLTRIKYIFDMRGFWADEKIDGNVWSRKGLLYRITKSFEKRFLLNTDHLVSLTHAAIREIEKFPYMPSNMPTFSIIPTCADLELFSPFSYDKSNELNDKFTLGYVGSVETSYMFDEVITCFIELLKIKPDSNLLIINRGQHDYIRQRLIAHGIFDERIKIISSKHNDIPMHISKMDAGIFFIKPVFSKTASCPTRFAEFLGCGVPCLANSGVGDIAKIIEDGSVGVTLDSFNEASMNVGLKKLLLLVEDKSTPKRCIDSAKLFFSLTDGVSKYNEIYSHFNLND